MHPFFVAKIYDVTYLRSIVVFLSFESSGTTTPAQLGDVTLTRERKRKKKQKHLLPEKYYFFSQSPYRAS